MAKYAYHSREGGAAHATQPIFTIVCGVSLVTHTLIDTLEWQGFHYDPAASTIIILDIPRGFALQTLENLSSTGAHRVVVTWSFCPEYWEDLWDLRPDILIVGDGLTLDLATAVTAAAQGRRYRQTPDTRTALSPAERRVLRLLAHNCSNEQIAARLSVRPQTVKNLVTVIYQKLRLTNRNEALLYYWDIWHVIGREPPS